MMPIVDPHVALSRDEFPLNDYLKQSDTVHVLRMVAVQRPQHLGSAIANLQYYRDTSTTRGFGGFPNGVVAYCDLAKQDSLDTLLNHDLTSTVRGVHYVPSLNQQTNALAHSPRQVEPMWWMRQLELLSSKAMSLDLTLSMEGGELVDSIIKCKTGIAIMITMQNWAQWGYASQPSLLTEQIERLAKFDNVNIKLFDSACSKNDNYARLQKDIISTCANKFGYDRMMFASCNSSGKVSMSIEEQWASYVEAADTFTALQRDKVFRTNAIRLYRL